jgi:ribosomal protein L11 methyltransferase
VIYPALDIRCDNPDLLFAAVDDFSPTAIEERDDTVRVFFNSASVRDDARTQLAARFEVSPIDVPDEDWARRSQADLEPVTVGRLTVTTRSALAKLSALSPQLSALTIVIEPSMGFGTGHHVTTRLCLEALQTFDLGGATVLDAGTGSGILAIAAVRLGAARAIGVDDDADAIQAARENLSLNPTSRVAFEIGDLRTMRLEPADVVTANLTGALLVQSASTLLAATRPGGALILSGLLAPERDDVVRAFGHAAIAWEREEDDWVGLIFKRNVTITAPSERSEAR